MDLDIEPVSDSVLREGIMGGTVEVDLEERGPETPSMVSIESNANESSCPSWLRKVCTTSYLNKVLFFKNRQSPISFLEFTSGFLTSGTAGCRIHSHA